MSQDRVLWAWQAMGHECQFTDAEFVYAAMQWLQEAKGWIYIDADPEGWDVALAANPADYDRHRTFDHFRDPSLVEALARAVLFSSRGQG